MGSRVETHRTVLGWPIPYETGDKSTTTFVFQSQRSPEVATQKQFRRKGMFINVVIGMLIGIATYWVTWHVAHSRFRFHLTSLFALAFAIAMFCTIHSHMTTIETVIGSEHSLSRLLTIPSQGERDFANAMGFRGLWLPVHVRLPLLFGIGAVFFLIGDVLLATMGRVFRLSKGERE